MLKVMGVSFAASILFLGQVLAISPVDIFPEGIPNEFSVELAGKDIKGYPHYQILTDTGKLIGCVFRTHNGGWDYALHDNSGTVRALALSNFWFSHGFTICDEWGKEIGKFKKTHRFPYKIYEVTTSEGTRIAKFKANFLGTSTEVIDPMTGELIALITNALFMADDEHVSILSPDLIQNMDSRLLLMALSFYVDTSFIRSIIPSQECFLNADIHAMDSLRSYLRQFNHSTPKEDDFISMSRAFEEAMEINLDPIATILSLLNGDLMTPEEKAALCNIIERNLYSP
jgi:hypothetical protein